MAVSSPQGVWTQRTVATNQRIIKPRNQSGNPASAGQDTIPRLNARLGIIRIKPNLFNSDRGCQYTSNEFADFCAVNGVRRSMGRRATCYNNAVSESFFATYKKELIHTRPWNDVTEVRQHTFLWIEGYYNRRRRHSTLGYLTPLEYELGYRKLTDLAA
jgi:transposase InsO family protein